jgi:hypothetical protein
LDGDSDFAQEVVAVQLTRQQVVDVFRKAGLPEMADKALHDLPDPVDSEKVAAWAVPYGINMDELRNLMGGSP